MHKDCPQRGDRIRNLHNLQKASTMKDVGGNISRTYAVLDSRKADH